jgi:hypothetical protein
MSVILYFFVVLISTDDITFSSIILITMTVSVHAIRSIDSRYSLDKYTLPPIEFFREQRTSAAIPAFHASPSAVFAPEINEGKEEGIYKTRNFLSQLKSYTRATSTSSFFVERNPFNTAEYITGITIIIAVNIGTLSLPIQTNARMINDATGVDLIIVSNGEKRISNILKRKDKYAKEEPMSMPIINPKIILSKEQPTHL